MTDEKYRETLDALQRERIELAAAVIKLDTERDLTARRLANVDATIRTITALLENAPPEMRLADSIREILKAAKGRPLTPLQVRDELVAKGYDFSRHSNPMAAIHSVLKRLGETSEFESLNKGQLYHIRPAALLAAHLATKGKRNERARSSRNSGGCDEIQVA